ncbi:MAG: flagellar hook capping FlgD N-terminal domain-containing protein [Balneolaceae bacterium]|jgi:flagellar basal-body rod modification protein FlgD
MNISNIAGLTQPTNSNAQAGKKGNKSLGKEDFLKLLVTQMKNQDPINPMDGAKFASQLAQFNSVEQLVNLNKGVDSLATSQQALNSGISNTMAASLAGKDIRAFSSKVGLAAGKDTQIQFKLNDIATEVKVTITDAAGNTVRTENLKNLGSGNHSWRWDGTSDAGKHVPEGIYSVNVSAKNGDDDVKALTFTEGKAEKVHYSSNGVELLVNGIYVPLGDVEEIGA